MAKDEKPKTKPAEAAPEAAGGGRKKILLLALVALLLIGGGIGGYFYWSSTQKAKVEKAPAAGKTTSQGKLLFYTLDPPFVANFEGIQSFRFLQVHVRISTRSQEAVDLMASIDPILRNDLLMLFGSQKAEVLATREGKEALRNDALKLVRGAVKNAGGDATLVDNIFFTSFVMQ